MYPRLRDHACVADYPDVPGMRANLFLLNHDKWEDSVKGEGANATMDDDMSKSNKYARVPIFCACRHSYTHTYVVIACP